MGLDGKTLRQVQDEIAAVTAHGGGLILDAATGAGETTLQIAEAMKNGLLVTVDCDPESWRGWAAPLLQKAGVADRVQFIQDDIRHLARVDSSSIDLVVSHSTLSAMGIWAIDGIKQFYRVLKPGARLVVADLLPETETDPVQDNVSALSWRLTKAAAHLRGEQHYEELPSEWIKIRLADVGFEIMTFEYRRTREATSQESYDEWRSMDCAKGIADEPLRTAIRRMWATYVQQAAVNGLTTKEGAYTCWARKP